MGARLRTPQLALGSEPGVDVPTAMASPFLPAGAATGCDSGGELSSGDESGEAEFLGHPEIRAPRNLAALFDKAAAHVQGLVQVASREQLLYLYARYKQVRSGGGGRGGPQLGPQIAEVGCCRGL